MRLDYNKAKVFPLISKTLRNNVYLVFFRTILSAGAIIVHRELKEQRV